jgi:hypothetical protein
MKPLAALLAAMLAAEPSISFFKYQRSAQAPNAKGQSYAVADESVWQHSRPDLGDLRLYSGKSEIPYTVETERGSSEIQRKELRVLQPGRVDGKTQFLLDMSGIAEYDRVELRLAAKDFAAHARVDGNDDLHGNHWSALGSTTLYDLSKEKLGHNSTLQIPLATYKYLRVTIDASLKPSDILGGAAEVTRPQKAVWQAIRSGPTIEQQGKDTLVTFSIPENVPVERAVFEIDAAQPNFRREVEVRGGNGQSFDTGEITRVHMQRGGQKIDVDQESVDVQGIGTGVLKLVVHNGDDTPLKIAGVSLQQFERRIYFEAAPGTQVELYYGDPKLEAPIYDYAKLFQRDENAGQVQIGIEKANPAFAGRPDERPWSERHPALLWGAILAAVLILGGMALKSIRTATA